MPGACDFNDEASKDEKCCVIFPSYMTFKILAWINIVWCTHGIIMLVAGTAVATSVADEGSSDKKF